VDIYLGPLLLVVAVVLAVTQRSAIARSLRAADSDGRRRRLRTAAVLAVVFIASFVAYLLLIGDTWTTRETVLAVIGNAAMIGAVGFLAAGLLTPKTHEPHPQNRTT
jgi:UDP-N-acetylmuramyl pentapeptide phosphotransferase/UDP-N-acetylglucosamine-1-phosphate transferase